jgi:carbon-monoxide dehydrogenase large subunit
MKKFGIGQPVRRREDIRLVTGQGRYTADITLENLVHAAFVRSPHAHANIREIDASEARVMPGVLGILTGEDLPEGLIMPQPGFPLPNRDGSKFQPVPQSLLAKDKVRFTGEAVALVIAETAALAQDAAEAVMVDYDPLPAAGTLDAAAAGMGADLWPTHRGNVAFDWVAGNVNACDEVFAKAAHVATIEIVQNRVVPSPIEPRAAIGLYDPAQDSYTLYTSSQGVTGLHESIAPMLDSAPERLRVVTPDVGGGFGMKGESFPEQILVLIGAKKFKRPVKWVADRTESFLADTHAREARTRAELALDHEGHILGLKISGTAALGAFATEVGPMVPTIFGLQIVGGLYRVPVTCVAVKGYFTNAAPIAPYRGAGRPEAAYITERVLDIAAREMGIDRAEIRRRNFIRKEELPYKNWFGHNLDCVDPIRNLDDALTRADWNGFAARRAQSETRGYKRGIGLGYYLETAAGPPVPEPGVMRFSEHGGVDVFVGTQSNGQGHETTFAQIVVEYLGVPFDSVRICQGDTAYGVQGGGTFGSRSLQMSGNAIRLVSEEVIRKGKEAAAHVLQAGGASIDFAITDDVGRFSVSGTERSITLSELAIALKRETIAGWESGLDSEALFPPTGTYPNGCHICEVEVDSETGQARVLRYTVVDDVGRVINPLLVEGQVHGGIAQGLGQAMLEDCRYDPESGQLLTASFTDYTMPRAADMPVIDFSYNEILSRLPLGSKGAGEAGTVGALPAIISAVADALGVAHIDMPATSEKIWRVLQNRAQ